MTIPDEHVPLIIDALQFKADYLRSRDRDSQPQMDVIELLKRKPANREEGAPTAGKKKRA